MFCICSHYHPAKGTTAYGTMTPFQMKRGWHTEAITQAQGQDEAIMNQW